MANYCSNWATFSGSETALKTMLDNIQKAVSGNNNEGLWYETYPITLGLDRAKVHYEDRQLNFDVYEEYGSKWFEIYIDSQSYEDGQGSVVISGDSAWSPISPWLLKLSEVYQLEVESVFEEGGNDFGGYYNCKNGVVTKDETYKWRVFRYLEDSDHYISDMFEDLDLGFWENLEEFKEAHDNEVFQFSAEDWADINAYFNKQIRN